jgi:hypothetical protein
MKNRSILSIILLLSQNLFGQSNPGYMGNTSAVEITSDFSFPIISGFGPYIARQTAISYEKSYSKDFGLKAGLRFGGLNLNAVEQGLDQFDVNNLTGESTSPIGGSLEYRTTEFFVSPKFYFTESGALAPFGSFIGLEFALTQVELEDKLKWNSQSFVFPPVTEGILALSMSIQWGQRRVIFDNFCYNYHFGLGFNIINSGDADISYFGDGSDTYKPTAVVHEMALSPIQWGRLFHSGVGISYLF